MRARGTTAAPSDRRFRGRFAALVTVKIRLWTSLCKIRKLLSLVHRVVLHGARDSMAPLLVQCLGQLVVRAEERLAHLGGTHHIDPSLVHLLQGHQNLCKGRTSGRGGRMCEATRLFSHAQCLAEVSECFDMRVLLDMVRAERLQRVPSFGA